MKCSQVSFRPAPGTLLLLSWISRAQENHWLPEAFTAAWKFFCRSVAGLVGGTRNFVLKIVNADAIELVTNLALYRKRLERDSCCQMRRCCAPHVRTWTCVML